MFQDIPYLKSKAKSISNLDFGVNGEYQDQSIHKTASSISIDHITPNYSNVESKVKKYIQDIKANEHRRRLQKSADALSSYDSAICLAKEQSKQEEFNELNETIEVLQKNYGDLLLKYAEAENFIEYLKQRNTPGMPLTEMPSTKSKCTQINFSEHLLDEEGLKSFHSKNYKHDDSTNYTNIELTETALCDDIFATNTNSIQSQESSHKSDSSDTCDLINEVIPSYESSATFKHLSVDTKEWSSQPESQERVNRHQSALEYIEVTVNCTKGSPKVTGTSDEKSNPIYNKSKLFKEGQQTQGTDSKEIGNQLGITDPIIGLKNTVSTPLKITPDLKELSAMKTTADHEPHQRYRKRMSNAITDTINLPEDGLHSSDKNPAEHAKFPVQEVYLIPISTIHSKATSNSAKMDKRQTKFAIQNGTGCFTIQSCKTNTSSQDSYDNGFSNGYNKCKQNNQIWYDQNKLKLIYKSSLKIPIKALSDPTGKDHTSHSQLCNIGLKNHKSEPKKSNHYKKRVEQLKLPFHNYDESWPNNSTRKNYENTSKFEPVKYEIQGCEQFDGQLPQISVPQNQTSDSSPKTKYTMPEYSLSNGEIKNGVSSDSFCCSNSRKNYELEPCVTHSNTNFEYQAKITASGSMIPKEVSNESTSADASALETDLSLPMDEFSDAEKNNTAGSSMSDKAVQASVVKKQCTIRRLKMLHEGKIIPKLKLESNKYDKFQSTVQIKDFTHALLPITKTEQSIESKVNKTEVLDSQIYHKPQEKGDGFTGRELKSLTPICDLESKNTLALLDKPEITAILINPTAISSIVSHCSLPNSAHTTENGGSSEIINSNNSKIEGKSAIIPRESNSIGNRNVKGPHQGRILQDIMTDNNSTLQKERNHLDPVSSDDTLTVDEDQKYLSKTVAANGGGVIIPKTEHRRIRQVMDNGFSEDSLEESNHSNDKFPSKIMYLSEAVLRKHQKLHASGRRSKVESWLEALDKPSVPDQIVNGSGHEDLEGLLKLRESGIPASQQDSHISQKMVNYKKLDDSHLSRSLAPAQYQYIWSSEKSKPESYGSVFGVAGGESSSKTYSTSHESSMSSQKGKRIKDFNHEPWNYGSMTSASSPVVKSSKPWEPNRFGTLSLSHELAGQLKYQTDNLLSELRNILTTEHA